MWCFPDILCTQIAAGAKMEPSNNSCSAAAISINVCAWVSMKGRKKKRDALFASDLAAHKYKYSAKRPQVAL
jgi:hypothetical protein